MLERMVRRLLFEKCGILPTFGSAKTSYPLMDLVKEIGTEKKVERSKALVRLSASGISGSQTIN